MSGEITPNSQVPGEGADGEADAVLERVYDEYVHEALSGKCLDWATDQVDLLLAAWLVDAYQAAFTVFGHADSASLLRIHLARLILARAREHVDGLRRNLSPQEIIERFGGGNG